MASAEARRLHRTWRPLVRHRYAGVAGSFRRASVTLRDASVHVMRASASLRDASVGFVRASVTLMDAHVRFVQASMRLREAHLRFVHASTRLREAGTSALKTPLRPHRRDHGLRVHVYEA